MCMDYKIDSNVWMYLFIFLLAVVIFGGYFHMMDMKKNWIRKPVIKLNL